MSACPCCPGTGIEVLLHDPNGWKTVYWCLACQGGGHTIVAPGQRIPHPQPRDQLRIF